MQRLLGAQYVRRVRKVVPAVHLPRRLETARCRSLQGPILLLACQRMLMRISSRVRETTTGAEFRHCDSRSCEVVFSVL